jgi:uncharacterized protein (TIGR03435 family)
MNDDMALVREYVARNSENAFAAIVSRYVNLVHSAALRQVGDPNLAEEITQTVFIILARKAATLDSKTVLPSWLYRTANFVSGAALKIQRRRALREQKAYMQTMIQETQTEVTWEQLSPLLDRAMAQLRESDRVVLVLRFFQHKNFKEVADTIGVDERAAQKRVARALEKLRVIFAKWGASSTSAMLAGAISAHSVQAAPLELARAATTAAMAKGTTATASTSALLTGALKTIAWTKARMAVPIGMGLLLATTAATVTISHVEAEEAHRDLWRVPYFNYTLLDLTSPQIRILPTKFSSDVASHYAVNDAGKWGGIKDSVADIAWIAYGFKPGRVFFPAGPPHAEYDFIATLAGGNEEALKKELKNKLGFVGRVEKRDADVLALKVRDLDAGGLKPPIIGGEDMSWWRKGNYRCSNQNLSSLAAALESFLKRPVIDETGLTGHYQMELKWKEQGDTELNRDEIMHALQDQLGLELVPDHQTIEMLVMEKAK